MQGKNKTRKTRCIAENLQIERALSLPSTSPKDFGNCHKKNISLAKQNSELKLKAGQLEEKLYKVTAELFEMKFECNSLIECNKKLELQKQHLQAIGRYGTRYFEKLGRSTEIMVEKFKRSLDLERELSTSKLEGMLTPSSISDYCLESERRKLTAIKEEAYSIDLTTKCHDETNTPKLIMKRSRSRQLFTDKDILEERDVLRNINPKSNSVGKRRDKNGIQVTPKNLQNVPVTINSSHSAPLLKQNWADKENEVNCAAVSNKMNLRSGIRKSYITIPQNRKLRQGDNQFISIQDDTVDAKFGSEIQIYDLNE